MGGTIASIAEIPRQIAKNRAPGKAAARLSGGALNDVQQIQDEQNHEDGAKTAARAISPIPAVRPGGYRADENEDQDDHEDGKHTIESAQPCAALARVEEVFFPRVGLSGSRLATSSAENTLDVRYVLSLRIRSGIGVLVESAKGPSEKSEPALQKTVR